MTTEQWLYACKDNQGLIVDPEGYTIARVSTDCPIEPTIRLMAAAPDMLQALQYIVNWNPTDWNPETARDLAIKAIQRAIT